MAIEAEALRDALRLALKFVDRAGGEGLGFVADAHNGYPETDAADVCEAVAKALGIEFGGTEYMALIGDGPLPILIHRSALAEDTARAAEGWEPIETAPKGRKPNGTMQFALLCAPYPTSTRMWSDIYQCWWSEAEERWMRWPHPFPPTLWMPSPAMPEGEPSGSGIVLRQLSDEEKRERAAALADARKRERSALTLDKEAADANR